MSSQTGNKRIALNTLYLYLRMILVAGIGIFTSRLVLKALGEVDYGVFDVVTGVVASISFLHGALGGASSRFITYALGEGEVKQVVRIFGNVLTLHLGLALAIFILAESLGLWFVCNRLTIPPERFGAALWIYQFAIISSITSVINIPYYAMLIAQERMDVFAYISIVEVLAKLGVILTILYLPADTLILYAAALCLIQLSVCLLYRIACRRLFPSYLSKPQYDTKILKQISGYMGWAASGNLAIIGYTQGLNILLNVFFGPAVNAARSLAAQVQAALQNMSYSALTAVRPQIIKAYANENYRHLHELVALSTKAGFFLLLLLFAPILWTLEGLLKIWLMEVPEYTYSLTVVLLMVELITPLKVTLINAIHATGNIRKFQIYEGGTLLLIVPIAYILLRYCSITPPQVLMVYLAVEMIAQGIRMTIVLPRIRLSLTLYAKEALLPIARVLVPLVLVYTFAPSAWRQADGIWEVALSAIIVGAIVVITIGILGMNNQERKMIVRLVMDKIKR